MGLTVHWTTFAKDELKNIFDYHKEKVNLKIAKKIVRQVVEKTKDLSEFPEMGVVEELLHTRPEVFRYLISTNYKIIYWINHSKNRVEVVDVFDTRRNPRKTIRGK